MSRKILDDMRDVMRQRHYSIRTERNYCEWVERFVLHFNMKSRGGLTEGEKKTETYLTFLAVDKKYHCLLRTRLWMHWCFYTLSGYMKVIEAALTILSVVLIFYSIRIVRKEEK